MVIILRLLVAFAQVAEGLLGILALGFWLPDRLTPAARRAYEKEYEQSRRRRAAHGRWTS